LRPILFKEVKALFERKIPRPDLTHHRIQGHKH